MFSGLVIVLGRDLCERELRLFQMLCRMNEVRSFKLTFLFEALDSYWEEVRRRSARVLELITANGSLGFLDSPPTVRIARPALHDITALNWDCFATLRYLSHTPYTAMQPIQYCDDAKAQYRLRIGEGR